MGVRECKMPPPPDFVMFQTFISTLLLELQCRKTYCYKLFTSSFTKQAVSVEDLIPRSLFRYNTNL